jgi:peptide chain release factor 1
MIIYIALFFLVQLGFKEASAAVSGEEVFKSLKFESGVHRVQRIPVNDTKIQTSAASVIVLPQAEDVDIELRPQVDIAVDVAVDVACVLCC